MVIKLKLFIKNVSLNIKLLGTYVYIEKPAHFELQRTTYSGQKGDNLVKMMVFVFGDGYILHTAGAYMSDGRNNDAKILEYITRKGDLEQFLAPGDAVIVDRGFRDVQGLLVDEGYQVHMPQLLQGTGRQQFTSTKANASRQVTMSRWVYYNIYLLFEMIFYNTIKIGRGSSFWPSK